MVTIDDLTKLLVHLTQEVEPVPGFKHTAVVDANGRITIYVVGHAGRQRCELRDVDINESPEWLAGVVALMYDLEGRGD